MALPPKKGIGSAILTAAVITLLVTLVRLFGELQGWDEQYFGRGSGGKGAIVGITWLVLPFGFWFGRRLAKAGHRPASLAKAMLLPILGAGLFAGVMWYAMNQLTDWTMRTYVMNGGAVAASLFALAAWPRAWGANLGYGLLARIPVAVVQYLALQHWPDTHYAKLIPGAPQEMALFMLTAAQLGFWTFGWTCVVGGLFAAFGAATVRR